MLLCFMHIIVAYIKQRKMMMQKQKSVRKSGVKRVVVSY